MLFDPIARDLLWFWCLLPGLIVFFAQALSADPPAAGEGPRDLKTWSDAMKAWGLRELPGQPMMQRMDGALAELPFELVYFWDRERLAIRLEYELRGLESSVRVASASAAQTARYGPDERLADAEFDRMVDVRGNVDNLFWRLDESTRRALQRLVAGGAVIEDGAIVVRRSAQRIEIDPQQLFEDLSAVGRRLKPMVDHELEAMLVKNIEAEVLPDVRRVWVTRLYESDTAQSRRILRACADSRHPDVRLFAALAFDYWRKARDLVSDPLADWDTRDRAAALVARLRGEDGRWEVPLSVLHDGDVRGLHLFLRYALPGAAARRAVLDFSARHLEARSWGRSASRQAALTEVMTELCATWVTWEEEEALPQLMSWLEFANWGLFRDVTHAIAALATPALTPQLRALAEQYEGRKKSALELAILEIQRGGLPQIAGGLSLAEDASGRLSLDTRVRDGG